VISNALLSPSPVHPRDVYLITDQSLPSCDAALPCPATPAIHGNVSSDYGELFYFPPSQALALLKFVMSSLPPSPYLRPKMPPAVLLPGHLRNVPTGHAVLLFAAFLIFKFRGFPNPFQPHLGAGREEFSDEFR